MSRPPNSTKMCLSVQPICNACKAESGPVELHECIFRDCKPEYIEKCTRFLTWFELQNWNCDTPGCGLNMNTIDSGLEKIQQLLRMEISLPIRPAQDNSGAGNGTNTNANDSEAGQILRDLDENGTSSSQQNRDGTEMDALPADNAPKAALLSITVPATVVDIPPRPQPAPQPGSSIQTDFDPGSVDLHAFPKCKNCFRDRRRCNRQTPCDKCQQRGFPGSCGHVTLELLRRYPARAERILRLANGNGAST